MEKALETKPISIYIPYAFLVAALLSIFITGGSLPGPVVRTGITFRGQGQSSGLPGEGGVHQFLGHLVQHLRS
jgi:hypothetical protein